MTRERAWRSTARAVWLVLLMAGGSCATGGGARVLSPADAAAGCGVTSPAPCEALCFRDRAAACAIFGAAVEGSADPPVRLPQDVRRARRALQRGCDLGSLEACRTLVSLDTDRAPPGQDCAGWEAICRRGDQRSCTFFAQCLDHVAEFRLDKAQALRLFEEGCARGERVACRELGLLSATGDGVPRDDATAFSRFDQACRLDDQLACADEGLFLERGRGVARDVERAKALYRVACKRGVRPYPCDGLRRLGETPPSTVVTSSDATETSFVSEKFDYEWRLPADWEIAAPAAVALHDAPAGVEVFAARSRGAPRDSLVLAVTDYAVIVPGGSPGQSALDTFEGVATKWLLEHGVSKLGSARTKYLGMDAVRVDGQIALPNRQVALVLFVRDRRRFELRCVTEEYQRGLPCEGALGALMIHAPKPESAEAPRVLHLREPSLGLSFDAPSDDWLARGPRRGFGGRQTIWMWAHDGRQITVSALDVSGAPRGTTEGVVALMAETFRKEGAAVVEAADELAGQPCAHLRIDKVDAHLDSFVQRRGGFLYGVLVAAPVRDAALLEQARAGLKLAEPQR
jgi:hypothetical protein